eukprot:g1676.t1
MTCPWKGKALEVCGNSPIGLVMSDKGSVDEEIDEEKYQTNDENTDANDQVEFEGEKLEIEVARDDLDVVDNDSNVASEEEDENSDENSVDADVYGENDEHTLILDVVPNPLDVLESMKEIKASMENFPKNVALMQEAMRGISLLSKDSKEYVEEAVEIEMVKFVLSIIERHSWDRNFRCYAAQAMCALGSYGLGSKVSLREAGTIDEFIGLMDVDYFDAETQAYASEALSRFAANSDNRLHIIDRGGIEAIIYGMTKNLGNADVQEGACHAFEEISKYSPTHAAIRDKGGLAAIISGLGACRSEDNVSLFVSAMKCFHTLAADRLTRVKLGSSGGIGMIIETLQLFRNNNDVAREAIKAAHKNCESVNYNRFKFVDAGGVGAILNCMGLLSGDNIVCENGCRAMQLFCGRNEEGKMSLAENAIYELIGVLCDNSEDCEDVESAIEEIGQIAEFLASDPQYAMPIVESGLVSNLIRSMEYCMNSSDATREVIHAFRQLGKIDEEAKLQCVTEGVIRPIIMGMNHHRNDAKVQAAGAHALGVYAKENPTVAQNIFGLHGPEITIESMNEFPKDPELAQYGSMALAYISRAVTGIPDRVAWRRMHTTIVENGGFPAIIQILGNFPENVEVQWKGLEALHMLTKYRKLAGVLSQQNGVDAAISAIAEICLKEDVDETENKKKKTMFKDGVEVEVPAAKTGKKKPLKKVDPRARVLEEALQTLVRIAFYSKDARDIISENNGVAVAVACMRLAGGNKDIHHYGAFLIGQLCADNKGNQEACFEEDACEVIVNCLKRYPGDRDVQLHALWAAVAITNGHASNQTSFALDGGFDAARKAMSRFANRSNKMNTYVSFWGRMLDNAINGKAVNIHDCQFFKCEYEDDEEEDENWGDLPGEKASEVIPEMIGIILNEASEYLVYRLSAATCIQRIVRGMLCRIQNKELISEIMAKIKALQE